MLSVVSNNRILVGVVVFFLINACAKLPGKPDDSESDSDEPATTPEMQTLDQPQQSNTGPQTIQQPGETSRDLSVTGSLTYEFVSSTGGHWDYENSEPRPIRGVKVVLINDLDGKELANTTSDEAGNYSLSLTNTNIQFFKVRVLAHHSNPPARVQDNTMGGAIYAMESASRPYQAEPLSINLHAGSGWSGSNTSGSYTNTRSAAPFAILDCLHRAYGALWQEKPSLALSQLTVNWSSNNAPVAGDSSIGEIGNAHWNGAEIFLRGKANVNADEYDCHVVVHEWAHYLEDTLGRTDNIGGSHTFGQALDPRMSFSEGFANAIASYVLQPNVSMIDVYGNRQQSSGTPVNLEDETEYPQNGWYNEFAISYLIYDLMDEAVDGVDSVHSGFGKVIDVLSASDSYAPNTIFSFVHRLKDANPSDVTGIDSITANFGIDDVADLYGSGESNDGGNAMVLPVFSTLTVNGANVSVDIHDESTEASNVLLNRRLIMFQATSTQTRLVASTVPSAVKFRVSYYGTQVGTTWETSSTGNQTWPTVSGEVYLLELIGNNDNNAQETYTFRLEDGI